MDMAWQKSPPPISKKYRKLAAAIFFSPRLSAD
jgi:hypothetical protein